MSKPTPYLNEIVSLAVMLLMLVALIAGQADATFHEAVAVDAKIVEPAIKPFRASIGAHIADEPLSISIGVTAELSYFRLEDE